MCINPYTLKISGIKIDFCDSAVHLVTVGITLVDETPAAKGENDSSSQTHQQQQLAEGLKFAYDAPDKTSTDQEHVSRL